MAAKTIIAENSPQVFKRVEETKLVAKDTAMTLLWTAMAPETFSQDDQGRSIAIGARIYSMTSIIAINSVVINLS